jgi:hypothetical protein
MAEKKHKYSHTHITHHADGSHSIHHEHEEGKHKDYARADHDGMMDGMMEHTSEPDEEESTSEAGDHGIDAAEAEKAGIPTPKPAGA